MKAVISVGMDFLTVIVLMIWTFCLLCMVSYNFLILLHQKTKKVSEVGKTTALVNFVKYS